MFALGGIIDSFSRVQSFKFIELSYIYYFLSVYHRTVILTLRIAGGADFPWNDLQVVSASAAQRLQCTTTSILQIYRKTVRNAAFHADFPESHRLNALHYHQSGCGIGNRDMVVRVRLDHFSLQRTARDHPVQQFHALRSGKLDQILDGVTRDP